ncbi:MAG: thiamine pyrophosphate-dependent enzyme, partial [Bacteroidota bacterium]
MENAIQYNHKNLSNDLLIELYKGMLKPRMIEEKMLLLLRQGKISKWFSGIGQEAIAVGCTKALQKDEIIFPMHRNLGVFTSRDIPLHRLFCQWQGKASGFTKGRDRSFHFGTLDYNIVGMISHLGPQLSLASGVALAEKLSKTNKVALAFTGEGGTSEGEFHEALNVASVWQLPVIFVIENNGYGLSTPVSEQYKCEDLADKGIGYGMEAYVVDGNNVLEVYQLIDLLSKDLRKNPRPVLIECKTFRMRGHEEASGTKYVPQELMDHWAKKDPLSNFENYLLGHQIISTDNIEEWKHHIKSEIDEELQIANGEMAIQSSTDQELADVFKAFPFEETKPSNESIEMRFIDAISNGLTLAMEKYPELILMGQDIADYGGVFKITNGFKEKFGGDRV